MRTLLPLALILLAACRGEKRAEVFQNAPVIIISVDTLRADRLPAYGYGKVATPHIDALRADSVLFERAWSHCPMTLPSHASMFTGMLPTEHGVRNNVGYRFERDKLRTLAEVLGGRGYHTGAAVSSYVLRSDTGIDDGFQHWDDQIAVAAAGAVSEHQRSGFETLKNARAWLSANASAPLLYFFHIYEPHAPYAPPEPFRSRVADPYDGEVAASDAIVGELIAHLKQTGIYDRAIVVFLSDHGEGLWDHGEDQHGILLYRESLHVPLLVKLPGSARKGTSVARAVPLAHLFGTVLSLTGAEASTKTFFAENRAPIYAETLYPRIHLGWSELRALIDGKHHYIAGPRAELYDLEADFAEKNDLASTERRVAASMRKQIDAMPAAIAPMQPIDPEEAAKLAALGYVGTPRERSGPLPNPRDEIGSLQEIKAAFALADARRYDEAALALRRLLDRNPRLSDVASKLGEILIESGRADEAVEVYRNSIASAEQFSPDLALAHGFALLKAGKAEETIRHAELALPMHPREAHELLARASIELRRIPEAARHAQAAIEAGDRQPTSLLLLAEVQRAAGDHASALATAEEAERRAHQLEAPHLYGVDYLRGDLLARMDRPAEAVAAYRREIARSPQHMQAYANLAVIHLIEGKRAEADRVLEEMARANPHRGAYLLAARTLEAFEDRAGAARWRARPAR